jgi:phosphoribosylamine--glycine ligase
MKVLLVGSGAREHALAWKLRQSALVDALWLWPGSAAMEGLGQRLDLGLDARMSDLARMAKNQGIDFLVVGPEQPLADGLADACQELKLPCFGPVKVAAQLESSKAFAKELMAAAGIPTASFHTVQGELACRSTAERLLRERGGAVIKASGLASGKGVFVCTNQAGIDEAIERLYRSGMAKAAETVVIEEILVGRECSFFVFLGAGGPTPLGFAVDHKRLKDGDLGPNTGGMGCYSPVPWLPAGASDEVMRLVVKPLLVELEKRSIDYTGCLYVGLMWGTQGPSVVEFNVRLGDPEAEVLALQDRRDWAALIAAKLDLQALPSEFADSSALDEGASVAVVLASPCYPFGEGETRRFEVPRQLFETMSPDFCAFGAAVRSEQGRLLTGKGRLLTLVARGADVHAARERVYREIQTLASSWAGVQFRQDIGLTMLQV